MPRQDFFKELFNSLSVTTIASSPHHFLFFLGTNTVYTPKPTIPERSYERGETLSYTAQAVAALLQEEGQKATNNDALSYSSPSVQVLNGPKILGKEVGDRIAEGILLALQAAANGKTTLQITAHSRGAVQGILLAHELERIKKMLRDSPNQSLKVILMASPCALTRAALLKLLPPFDQRDTLENRTLLADRLEALQTNLFLIDPVPGDTAYALPGFGWSDKRFYEKTPCNNYELLICRDERTACFYTIVPNGMVPIVISGHHGSACGNARTQQYTDLPENLRGFDTTSVQDLVLLKIFNFLHRNTQTFKQQTGQLDIGHLALDRLTNEFLSCDEMARKQLLLQQYTRVNTNDVAYQYFSNTSYAYLGRKYAADKNRCVHNHNQALVSLSYVVPAMRGSINNLEHAKLVLEAYIEFSKTDVALDVQVTAINMTLENLIIEMSTYDETSKSKLLEILLNPAGMELFVNGLSIIVDTISQKYLQNSLSPADKSNLMHVITQTFKIISSAIKNDALTEAHKEIFIQLQNVLVAGVKQTIETHYNATVHRINEVHQQILAINDENFKLTFKQFLQALNQDASCKDTEFAIRLNSLSESNPTIAQVQTIFTEELKKAREISLNEGKEISATGDKFSTFLQGDASLRLQACFEAAQLSTEEYLVKMSGLYEEATELFDAYPQLNIICSNNLAVDSSGLLVHKNSLATLAGSLLQERNYNLRQKPANVSEEFFNCAKSHAIALGVPSPELEDLDKRMQQLNSPREAECTTHIEAHLLPLTTDYLDLLLERAQKHRPQIQLKNYQQQLPSLEAPCNEVEEEAYRKIKFQFEKAQNLYQQLTDKTVEMPSERIKNFTNNLKVCQKDASLSLDPTWKDYAKSCLLILAILAAGVIPGLLGVALYSKVTGKSVLFFNHNHGANYIKNTLSVTEKIDEKNSSRDDSMHKGG